MSLRRLSVLKQLVSLLIIGILFVSIYGQAVEASVVFGPVQYARATGSPGGSGNTVSNGSSEISNGSNTYVALVYGPEELTKTEGSSQYHILDFTIDHPQGNYTLYVRNGDLAGSGNASSSAEVWLNSVEIFGQSDFKKQGGLLKKNISPDTDNQLKVKILGEPGSHIYVWIEDESPDIVITSPLSDTIADGMVVVSGYTTDKTVKTVVIMQSNNSTPTSVPVSNGNFTSRIYVHAPVKLTVSATDSTGTLRTTSLCLDGDYLPTRAELQYGFDPLDADSDSKLTVASESANGIPDGFEILSDRSGGMLPTFMKYMLGGDPLTVDSNGNGLTDYFEFAKLGIMNVGANGSAEMALPGEDPDHDGLANLLEQSSGTDPLMTDTDGEGLLDGYEVNVSHTSPLLSDTDSDGLDDATELRLGTDPNNPDTNGNGILDSMETYTTTASNDTLGVSVSVTGKGDLASKVSIVDETSGYYGNVSARVSPLVDIGLNDSFDSAKITIRYDVGNVSDPSNLSLFYYNESLRTFIRVQSTVDPANGTVSAVVGHFSMYAIFYVPTWKALFTADMNAGRANTSFQNVDVMLTIDCSGSMWSSDYYGYRKTAAKNFVGALLPGDRAGVVFFESLAYLKTPLTSDFNAVNASINSAYAGGGTGIDTGLHTALDHLTCNGNKSHAQMIILLTDGENNGWYNDFYTYYYAGLAKVNNVTIYTVGLGNYVDTQLLINVANITGGNYYSVSSADQLPQVFRVISGDIDSKDSDEDGLSDTLEINGFRDGLGHWYHTDPYDNDTDVDGLTDGLEAGQPLTNDDGKYYYTLMSDPTNPDGDEDGLSDYDEVYGTTIYVANTHDSAQNFMNAVQQGSDATQYLTALSVTSNPLNNQSDNDGIGDGDEIMMGTDPRNSDTDGDSIADNLEESYGEDPTIFDLTPPGISLGDWNVYKDSFSLTTKYYFMYTVKDPGGIKDISIVKNDLVKDSVSYQSRVTASSSTTYFETDWETLLDALRTAKVDVNSDDWNGNSGSVMVYHRPSMYGQWAAQIGSDTFLSGDTSYSLGALSGFSDAVAETPEMVVQVANDPAGYLSSIEELAGSLASDPAMMGQLVASLPQAVIDEQELANPYPEDSELHATFAAGWYSGYTAGQLFMMWAGGEVVKSITSSEQFARISDSVLSKLDDAKAALKASKTFGVTAKVGTLLVEKSTMFSSDVLSKVLEKVPTAAKKAIVSRCFGEIGYSTRPKLAPYTSRIGELLGGPSPGDAANLIKLMDDDTLIELLTLGSDSLSSDLVSKLCSKLGDLETKGIINSDEASDVIKNTGKLRNIEGIDKVVERVSTANDYGGFKGAAFEIEYAASKNVDDIIEMGMDSNIGQPGDVDLIMREGANKVGYELKNIDYSTWIKYKNKFANENAGLKALVQNGKINDYKFVFKELPPDDMINWLNSKYIPWDWVMI